MDRIAVLIPCFNESQTIRKVVTDWKRIMPEAVIYVYDNNSSDGTDKIAKEAGAVVRYEYMQGKGNVIRRMFREIDAMCYIMVDGDDTYPAEAGPLMAEEVINNNIDMVIGDRLSSTYFTENKRPFHNLGNRVTRFLINSIFNTDIKDIMTGLRAFSYKFVKSFPVLSGGFELETEMTIHAVDKRMSIKNCVIEYRDRPENSFSKLNTVSDGIKVIQTIIRLVKNYKPFQFYGIISLLGLVISVLLFIFGFFEYPKSESVSILSTLVVSAFLAVTSLLSLAAGSILDTMVYKGKQDFEFRLQIVEHFFKEEKSKEMDKEEKSKEMDNE